MRQPFLRYITGDAGHVERLYYAVKIASDYPDIAALQREVLNERNADSKTRYQHRGLGSPRSYEPHQALAREIGLLERGERWRVTSSVGRPFLFLWEVEKIRPPKFLLLSQFIRYDKAMTVPLLKEYLKNKKTENAAMAVARIWDDMWKKFPREMETAEPPLPLSLRRENGELKRTCYHHALFRIRFLTKEEGLHLQDEQLKRLIESFENYLNPKFPSDYYSKMGFIETGKKSSQVFTEKVYDTIVSTLNMFRKSSHTSGTAVFHYLNSKILPEQYLDWNEFLQYLRSSGRFSIHPGFDADDILISIKRDK